MRVSPKCRRSGGHPCSQSRARAGSGCASGFPATSLRFCLRIDAYVAVVVYLEGKVLEEVSSAVGLVGLGAGAGIDPNTDGRGLGVGRVLGGNGEAVAEGGALGLGAVGDGSSETAEARQRAILDGVDGGAAARGVLQVQCEPTGSHCRGHCWRRVCGRRWGERVGGSGSYRWLLLLV